jgi:hypothetical protein
VPGSLRFASTSIEESEPEAAGSRSVPVGRPLWAALKKPDVTIMNSRDEVKSDS